MAMATVVLAVLLTLAPAHLVFADQYTVGDSSGWSQGVNYGDWTNGKTFKVGDTLLFTYGGSHSVDVVSKSDYDNCAATNVISSHSDGNTVIKLDKEGAMYFLCPVAGHCSSGMKLAVTVSAASSPTPSGGSPPANTTPPTSGTPTGPSGPTTSTPPSGTTTPPSSPNSPSAAPSNGKLNGLMMVVGALMFAPILGIMG